MILYYTFISKLHHLNINIMATIKNANLVTVNVAEETAVKYDNRFNYRVTNDSLYDIKQRVNNAIYRTLRECLVDKDFILPEIETFVFAKHMRNEIIVSIDVTLTCRKQSAIRVIQKIVYALSECAMYHVNFVLSHDIDYDLPF